SVYEDHVEPSRYPLPDYVAVPSPHLALLVVDPEGKGHVSRPAQIVYPALDGGSCFVPPICFWSFMGTYPQMMGFSLELSALVVIRTCRRLCSNEESLLEKPRIDLFLRHKKTLQNWRAGEIPICLSATSPFEGNHRAYRSVGGLASRS